MVTQAQQNPKTKAQVLIVGAGPVGLLTALRLGQDGVDTLVIESHEDLLPTTRAVVYMPVVIPVLTKLGIMEKVRETAFINKEGVVWRDVDGARLARLPLTDEKSEKDDGVLLIGQWKMNRLIMAELKKYPSVEVRFGLKCVGIEDLPEANTVKVLAHSNSVSDYDVILEAEYVVGTDGANSSVRRSLCLPFEGFTYQEFRMIGTDIIYDFVGKQDYSPLNFVVHEKDWAVIAYTGQDEEGLPPGSGKPQWRVAYVESPDLPNSKEEIRKRADAQMKRYIPKGGYRVIRAEPYTMSQRVASAARKGRVVLAGDALHSNNPIGGLGLTGGILDAFCYGNALARIIKHEQPDSLLTACASSRRDTWIETTNKLSQANLKRLHAMDSATSMERNGFFEKLNDERISAGVASAVRKAINNMLVETFEQ